MTRDELKALIRAAQARFDALPPKQQAAHRFIHPVT